MNKLGDQIFSFIASNINEYQLYKKVSPAIIHPFYHTVTDDYLPHIDSLYKPKTFENFKKDIRYLIKYFQPISVNEVFDYIQRKKELKDNSFHLSFDDGLREIYTLVMPYLYEKGIPATIFVNSDFVDNKNLFFRHKAALIIDKIKEINLSVAERKEIKAILNISTLRNIEAVLLKVNYIQKDRLDAIAGIIQLDFFEFLQKEKPYLTRRELIEMQEKGFTIAAHSIDHPPFIELKEEEQIRQVNESVQFIRQNFKKKNSFFSFPFSDVNLNKSLFEKLYTQVDLTFGITGMGTQYMGKHIARIDMENYGKDAKEAINKACLKYFLKEVF